MTLDGRVALVTGGLGGIGQAVCARLASEGARVYAADLTALNQGAESPNVARSSQSLSLLPMDVTSEASVAAAIDSIERKDRRLDIVVNAAGVEIEGTIEETPLEQWNRCMAVNATGTFLVSRSTVPLLRRTAAKHETSTSIVNFGSYDGFIADPGLAAYCASKGAVHALTRAMACDHGPEGIRVNAVCPGYIDTPMLQGFFNGEGSGGAGRSLEQLQDAVREIHPLRRYGTPTDVANLVSWLAGDEATYASGQLWVLDGGLSAQVQQMRL